MTSQGRRKHCACLFRFREHCPFRKLRRNKCSDSMSSVVLPGAQWVSTQAMAGPSGSNGVINAAVSVETFPRPPVNLQEELSAMDTDTQPSTSTARPSYMVSQTAGRSNFIHIHQQHHDPSSSDTTMDLDSGVDPETGERAQG